MASTLLHYAIALKIADCIKLQNKEMFLIGSAIGPDAASHEDGSYEKAHFQVTEEQGRKVVVPGLFYEKYSEVLAKDDFCRGYYCHLIQDMIWDRDVVDAHMQAFAGASAMEAYNKCLRDYGRLNYILTEKYKLKPLDLKKVSEALAMSGIAVDEISMDGLGDRVNRFPEWFDAKACSEGDFEMFDLEGIEAYINKCVKVCVEMAGC